MQTHKKLKARVLSLALSAAMVTTMLPMTVFAAEGDAPIGASTVGTIQSFDKLEGRFILAVGNDAPDHVYGLSVALNTPVEDLDLPDELTAMVARTTTVSAPSEDKPIVDSGKPSQSASSPDVEEEVKEKIKDKDVLFTPEPEKNNETTVTTVEPQTILVTWLGDKEYKSDENGKFIYTAVLPAGYMLADGVKLPQIYVYVGKQARGAVAPITASINGTAYEGATLEAAIAASRVAPTAVTTLKITAGKVTTADWKYLTNLSALNTFEIDAAVTDVVDIPSTFSGTFPKSITSVTVPQAIVIGSSAFSNCDKLTSVSFPKATTIGDSAFDSCKALTSINFPEVTSIKNNAFVFCVSLTNATFPKVEKNGGSVFKYCSQLTSVSFPKATSIGAYMFSDCTHLATLKLGVTPPTVSNIDPFKNCPDTRVLGYVDANGNDLAGADLTTAQRLYKAVDDGINDNLWYGWTIGAAVASPITASINGTAYEGVTLQAIVEANGGAAAVTSLKITAGKVTTADWKYLTNLSTLNTFEIDSSITDVANIPSIGMFQTLFPTSIVSVTVPQAITISSFAFLNCTSLTTANFPAATSIATNVFSGCNKLTNASFPSVTEIETGTFSGCTGLITASFPKVTNIDNSAFDGCSTLATLKLGVTPPTIGDTDPFRNCPPTRVLGYVDANGNDLTGDALTTAQGLYKAVDDGINDNLWYGWTIRAATNVFTVTFDANGGNVSTNSLKTNENGKLVTLPTPIRSGYSFNGWFTAATGGTKIDLNYTFSNNTNVYAHWTQNGQNPNPTPSGRSSSRGTSLIKHTEPATGSSNATAIVDKNGNIAVNVTGKNISDAVQAAEDAASKKGVNVGKITAVINVTAPANSNPNTVTVNLPKTVQQQVINGKIDNLAIVIDKPDISIGMNLATIKEMNKQANSDIQLSATRTDATKLSTEAKNAIGSRPAFDLKATYASGSKSITNFGTGTVSVAIPYTLLTGEVAGGVYAVYVDGNGKVNYITNSSYDAKNKVLRFSTNHFSVYGISYKAPTAQQSIE